MTKIKKFGELGLQSEIKEKLETYKEFNGIGETIDGYVIFLKENNQEIRNFLKNNYSDINFDIKIVGNITTL